MVSPDLGHRSDANVEIDGFGLLDSSTLNEPLLVSLLG